MTLPTQTIESLTLNINQEIRVAAPLEVTFAAFARANGPAERNARRQALADENRTVARWPLVPGPRGQQRPFLGACQAIKRPTLLELTGPLFM